MSLSAAQPIPVLQERRPIRVMIVDDSLVIRGVIARTLKEVKGVDLCPVLGE